MRLSFDADEIEKWARFSGDRNPIHFDREAARRLNVDDVVVHGMLVLLPVKQQLCELERQGADGGWMQFKTLLKAPVLRDRAVTLSVRDKAARTGFKLHSDHHGGGEHMIGDMRRIDSPQWQSTAPVHVLGADEVKQGLGAFKGSFGARYHTWIGLDALVFGHFIRQQVGTVFDQLDMGGGNAGKPRSIEELSEHLLIQISHQTAFCTSLRSYGGAEELGEVHYQIDNISLTRGADSAFGTLDLGVQVNGSHVMTIVLGLMVKQPNPTTEGSMP